MKKRYLIKITPTSISQHEILYEETNESLIRIICSGFSIFKYDLGKIKEGVLLIEKGTIPTRKINLLSRKLQEETK